MDPIALPAGRLPIRAVVYDGWYRGGDPQGLGDPVEIEKRLRGLGFHNLGDHMFRVRGAKSSADGGIGIAIWLLRIRSAPIDQPTSTDAEDAVAVLTETTAYLNTKNGELKVIQYPNKGESFTLSDTMVSQTVNRIFSHEFIAKKYYAIV